MNLLFLSFYFKRLWLFLSAAFLLTACQTFNVPYEPSVEVSPSAAATASSVKDSGPEIPLNVDHIPDAVPINEPRTSAGNKNPYEVLGKTYHLVANSHGFEQQGYASWYGKKFHGQKTSNGEIYNMYGMTAAHKTLPILVFAEVTNLENGKKIVVRINDRGPFHSDRIIDLTYTGARKLGFEKTGTARIKLRVIEPARNAKYAGLTDVTNPAASATANIAPKPRNSGGYEIPHGTYLQLGAYSDPVRADAFKAQIKHVSSYPITIEPAPERKVFRVLLGPLKDNWDLVQLQQSIIDKGYQEPKVVYRKNQ